MVWITKATYIRDFIVKIEFNDKNVFEVDLRGHLVGGILESLNDVSLFSKLSYDPELETVVWENGADLAPEFLYELGKRQSQQNKFKSKNVK